MKNKLYTLLMAVCAIVWLVQARAQRPGATVEVKIDNFSFAPAVLTVALGTTVTWINHDDIPHTVVSTEGKVLKSKVLDTDDKFSYRFDKAGTFPYFCSIHTKMTGKVIVRSSMPSSSLQNPSPSPSS